MPFGRNRSNCGRDMVIFYFSRSWSPLSWIYNFFAILTAAMLKRSELRRRAKFGRNPSNRSRDMTIFRFFQRWRPSAILDLLCVCVFRLRTKGIWCLYRCVNFGWNRCSSFDNMHLFRFHEFGLKTPIHAPKMGVFVGFDPLNGGYLIATPKRH